MKSIPTKTNGSPGAGVDVTITLNRQVCISRSSCRRIPHGVNQFGRLHWQEQRRWKRAWQALIYMEVLAVRPKLGKLPLLFPEIFVTFYQTRPYDVDNAYSAAKALVDALKVKIYGNQRGAGVIADDDAKHLKTYRVEVVKVKKIMEEKTTIRIVE